MARKENRQAYKELVKELKLRPNFIIIATDGEHSRTFMNGDDSKLVAALSASIISQERLKDILKICLNLLNEDLTEVKADVKTKKNA